MARPVKNGLDYFPKDTAFYRDRKIRALIGRFGADGAVLYDYILCEVYGGEGYFTAIDESFADIAAADLGMSPEKIGLILDYLLDKSMLLDGTLFKAVKALTSHGIQTRYQQAVRERAKKRDVAVSGELWLLDEAETESFIKVREIENSSRKNRYKPRKNEGFSREKSLKESKVKESKGKEIHRADSAGAETAYCTDVQRIVDAWNSLGLSQVTRILPGTDRYQQLRKRLRDYGAEEILRAIENARESDFLMGRSDRSFQMTFDWFIRPNNFPKVLSGNYNRRTAKGTGTPDQNGTNGWMRKYIQGREEDA